MEKVLIVKCEPLGDQWECDANRIPLVVTTLYEAQEKYNSWEYEWYAIQLNGTLKIVKEGDF